MINSIRYFEEECITKFEKLEDNFMKNPIQLAEYVTGITTELYNIGLNMIQDSLETMDQMLQDSALRLKYWVVESHTTKQLITSLGMITFRKTLFRNRETGHSEYLLDRILGLERNERLTEDAVVKLLNEAVQTSYRRGDEETSRTSEVSKQTVKNKIHQLEFPENEETPGKKKEVEYLYIDADEDHVSLQFQEKKGDLRGGGSLQKNNNLITKLVYIYEGIENESPKSKRHCLINPHYFCGVNTGEGNQKFWKTIYVLDEFHLEKYIKKLTSHMKDSRGDAAEELRKNHQERNEEGVYRADRASCVVFGRGRGARANSRSQGIYFIQLDRSKVEIRT